MKGAKKPGRYGDGGGLYLNVSASGSKSWVFIWARAKLTREMGLGSYPAVTCRWRGPRLPIAALPFRRDVIR